MWSHYANGHRGFCLEFDTRFEPFSGARKVEYCTEVPKIKLTRILQDGDTEAIWPMFLAKYETWSYEEEWRLAHLQSRHCFGYSADALTGVYFGAEIDFAYVEIIALILQGQSPNVKLWHATKDTSAFAVRFEEKSYTPFIKRTDK